MATNTTEDLLASLNSLHSCSLPRETERVRVRAALEAALARVETPWETALRITFVQPALYAALKVCYDVRLFPTWLQASGPNSKKTADQLAELVGVDRLLMARILRHLGTSHVIEQPIPDTYALTPYSMELGKSDLASTVPFIYNTTLPAFTHLPDFLKSEGYKNPTAADRTNWHHFRGLSRFDDLAQRPEEMAHFQRVMATRVASYTPWTDLYPVELAIEAVNPDAALVVDVGGARGHDLAQFQSLAGAVARRPGALILQDQSSVVGHAIELEGMTAVAHDFFEEQPVQRAKIYYLHKVLHDWPDAKAIMILKRLADAMESNYSRILLHEIVIRTDVSSYNTASDMTMMAVVSAMERTDDMWTDVIETAGLKVKKIWTRTGSAESIIEVVK